MQRHSMLGRHMGQQPQLDRAGSCYVADPTASRRLPVRSRNSNEPELVDCPLTLRYTDVADLDGGINAWKEQGKPVEDSSG
jgi:hypothetical protein